MLSFQNPVVARLYNYFHKLLKPESAVELIKQVAVLPKAAMILDVGGGTGTHADLFTKEGHQVVILDPSKEMLSFVRNPKIIKKIGKADKIPFEDNSFDLVYCIDAFHHFSNGVEQKAWQKVYDGCVLELRRVVKKNGKITIIEFNPSSFVGKMVVFFEKPFGSCFFSSEKISELFKKFGDVVKIYKFGHQYLALIKKK